MTSYKPPFPFRDAVDLSAAPNLGAQIPPSVTYLASVDASGFNVPVFLRAGEGVVGVSAFNGASNVVTFGGAGFDVSEAAGTFTVANDGVVSVAAGTGGVTVTGTAQNPIISATTGTLPQSIGVSLGQFVGTAVSGGGTADSVFTSPTTSGLSAGVYLLTFSWRIPFACFTATSATFSYAQLYLNGAPTGQLMKSTLVGGSSITAGGQYPGFQQTVTGIVTIPGGFPTVGYTVFMTNSILVNATGSLCSYSAVKIA
jgi:hypothetical protein